MLTQVDFYKTASGRQPILDFLKKLEKENRQEYISILAIIDNIEELGIDDAILMSSIKKIRPRLWEIKSGTVRILFTQKGNRIIILVHGFIKKSNKTPKKDIDTALKRIKIID